MARTADKSVNAPDVTTFTRVELDFVLTGVDQKQAAALVEGFKRR